MIRRILGFLVDESGPTAVEYAVLLAMILVLVIGAVGTVGVGTGGLWSENANAIDSAM
jgi:pilus assembly protein Flp/PilA